MNEEKFTVKEEVLDLEDLIFPSTSQKPYCYDLNTKSETFVKSETDIKPGIIFDISGKNQNNVSIETEILPTTANEDSVEYNLPYGWKKVGFQRKDKGGLITEGLLILVRSSIRLPTQMIVHQRGSLNFPLFKVHEAISLNSSKTLFDLQKSFR